MLGQPREIREKDATGWIKKGKKGFCISVHFCARRNAYLLKQLLHLRHPHSCSLASKMIPSSNLKANPERIVLGLLKSQTTDVKRKTEETKKRSGKIVPHPVICDVCAKMWGTLSSMVKEHRARGPQQPTVNKRQITANSFLIYAR